jgi:2-polyprenyl-3-methyl-5-hydroxy-6-metoxy-1,4-benzoquinol methylase
MDTLTRRYSNFALPAVSYATVRDFCDSVDQFGALATVSGDLKDVQRPWMIKAILGGVRPGGRLIEIGAGQPLVADMLTKLGYAVTIVDPYDGSGNGPREYAAFRATYPHVQFIREVFDDRTPGLQPGGYDAVYSVSVLEHIPLPALAGVCAGIHRFLVPGSGRTIHAIDHVLQGLHADYHAEHLQTLTDRLGVPREALTSTLDAARADVDTYFLSAESHNRWRHGLPYDQFPMRRVISVQICLPQTAG